MELSHPLSAGGQGRSPKLKLDVLESGPIVDKAPGGKEVVKPANVVPTVLHPSDARIDGMMA